MTDHAWILETEPYPEATDVSPRALVSIRFRQEMNRFSLNARNILILDGNEGGKLISDRFLYRYDASTLTLAISAKETDTGFGSDNCIEIIIAGRVANSAGKSMDVPYHFRFKTR